MKYFFISLLSPSNNEIVFFFVFRRFRKQPYHPWSYSRIYISEIFGFPFKTLIAHFSKDSFANKGLVMFRILDISEIYLFLLVINKNVVC